jgi:uncharacterized protein YciI
MPYYVVIRERAESWDWSQPMRHQRNWAAHAAFMEQLVDDGFIVAGGPLGSEDEAKRVLHIIDAADENAVRARLAEDPWPKGMLDLVSINPWTVLLGQLPSRGTL